MSQYSPSNPRRKRVTQETIMAKVDRKTVPGCWLWTGSLWPDGTPLVSWLGQSFRGRKYFWTRLHGPSDAKRLHLQPTCDQPLCVNPDHVQVRDTRKPAPVKVAGPTPEERFWKHVHKHPDGCWLWEGGLQWGAPRVWFAQEDTRAWVTAWTLVYGEKPQFKKRGTTCGDSLCIRPEHQKGTLLTRIEELRALYLEGLTHQEIATRCGVKREAVTKVLSQYYRDQIGNAKSKENAETA